MIFAVWTGYGVLSAVLDLILDDCPIVLIQEAKPEDPHTMLC